MSLLKNAQSAVIWNAGFNLLRDLLQFVSMLVLVRLLAPNDYGHFAFVTSFIGLINVLSFSNYVAHTLQVETEEEVRYQQHFTAGAALNGGAFLVANVAAVILARIPGWAASAPLLHVLSLTFLLEWPCELRRKMIERQFDWKTLRSLHAIGIIASVIVAIIMALAGAGAFALVIPGMLVTLPFIFDLFIRQKWRPTWEWDWKSYRAAFQFGIVRSGSGMMGVGRTFLETTTFAAVLGFGTLGTANRAIGLGQLLCIKVSFQVLQALYPILARITKEKSVVTNGLVLRVVAWTTIPLAVGISVLAGPLVTLVYGSKWLAVIPILPAAMAWAVASAVFQASYSLLLARNGQRVCLAVDGLVLTGTTIALFGLLHKGVSIYLYGTATVMVVALTVCLISLLRRDSLLVSGIILAFAPPAVAGAAALTASLGWLSFLHASAPEKWLIVSTVPILFALTYGAVIRLFFCRALEEVVDCIPLKHAVRKALFLKRVERPLRSA